MLSLPAAIKVYLCTVACDLRRYADSRTMPNVRGVIAFESTHGERHAA